MKQNKPTYTNKSTVIIPLKNLHITKQTDNTHAEITIDWSCEEYSGMPTTATLKIQKTNKPTTESDKTNSLYKWGGYPTFIQGHIQPLSEDGRLYHYICTIQNDWGDMGNANIFALIGEWENDTLTVQDVYVEASCH